MLGKMSIVGLVVLGAAGPVKADVVFDLAADWSDTTNPNGAWSYNKSPGTPFTSHVNDWDAAHLNWFDTTQPAWAGAIPQQAGHVPFWMKIVSENSFGGDLPIGSVAMHGVEGTQPAVWPGVTWTSPTDGMIQISGGVWLSRPSDDRSMLWQILRDGETRTEGTIAGSTPYSSSTPFDFADGSGGLAVLTMPVSEGTVITFQADRAPGASYADMTGLNLTITATAIPEPSTLTALSGLLGMGILGRWWRRRRAA